ncbi:MAG: PAS domain-containing protein [Pseudomonadota bacterium]
MERLRGHGAEVVSLAGHIKALTYNPIAEVEAYWEALRGSRLVPLRSEVDPRGFERALEYSFLIEKIAPGLARFRLAGSRISDIMGMEVRGMPLTSMFTPPARQQIQDVLNRIFEAPETAQISLSSETGLGRPPLSGKLALYPLKSDLGDISRALGCFSCDGKIGRAPRRFNCTSIRYGALGPFKTPQPEAAEPAPADQAPGFAEAPAPFKREATRDKNNVTHLRLVKSEDTKNNEDDAD